MKKPLHAEFLHGIELFNQARFFDAHEVLEDVWRASRVEDKKFQQGLIQIAVALYHHENGNSIGARSVLRRSYRNLSRYPEGFGGVRLSDLLEAVAEWQRAMDEDQPVPPLPKIVLY